MRVRPIIEADWPIIRKMHADSGLPLACLPDLHNPLFRVKIAAVHEGKAVQAGFVKLTGEAFVLLDHGYGTPQERWDTLALLISSGLAEAARIGLDQVTCWLPPEVEAAFGKRLEALGFIRSPWISYTANLK